MSLFHNQPIVSAFLAACSIVVAPLHRIRARRAHDKAVRHRIALLRLSSLFDGDWYLDRYPDVSASGADPAVHFLKDGWREGRDPGPHFSTTAYLVANADVAATGANPLIHFLEHGLSEGRSALDHQPSSPLPLPPCENFGEAAPCLGFKLQRQARPSWRRAEQFDRTRADAILIRGEHVGYGERSVRIVSQFERLAALSGLAAPVEVHAGVADQERDHSPVVPVLVDAWYATTAIFRTRWLGQGSPSVLRAYQHDPSGRGALCLVGEAALEAGTSFADVGLTNSYFPILFVHSDPDGLILGSRLIAFPSLSRGGTHYPELLAAAPERLGKPLDPLGYGDALAAGLLGLRSGSMKPAIRRLACHLGGADGTSPLFQTDLKIWLRTAVGISVVPRDVPDDDAGQHLASKVQVQPALERPSGGELILAGDMVPTIQILQSGAGMTKSGVEALRSAMPLLVARADHSQPVTLFDAPPTDVAAVIEPLPDKALPWPIYQSDCGIQVTDRGAPAAIRVANCSHRRDPERLVPSMVLNYAPREQAIGWLIHSDEWNPDSLAQSLHALGLQDGAWGDAIAIIGGARDPAVELCRDHFQGRVLVANSAAAAASALATPLMGYLGRGILLHDRRCSSVLAKMVEEAGVASAACIIVHAGQRGRGWNVGLVDAGNLAVPPEERSGADWVDLIWGATYPVNSPPERFWVARSELVSQWPTADYLPSGQVHLCTSLVTASDLELSVSHGSRVRVPTAASSLQVTALFG